MQDHKNGSGLKFIKFDLMTGDLVIFLANDNRCRQSNEPIDHLKQIQIAGVKCGKAHNSKSRFFGFISDWLIIKVARDFLANHNA